MPPTIGGVTIDPQGQTLTVSITPAAKVYTDQTGTTLASFPATVTTRTSYWMTAPQRYTVSVKTPQGNEIADASGNALVVDVQQGVMQGIAPVIDRPGPEDIAASGPYVPSATFTAKGDLIVGTAAGSVARLPAGSDGRLLVADSTQTAGVAYTGLGATVVVAASTATAAQKAHALASGGAVCDGTDDGVEINAAVDLVGAFPNGGLVQLTDGTFNVVRKAHPTGSNVSSCVYVRSNVTLAGAGVDKTIIKVAANQTVNAASTKSYIVAPYDYQPTRPANDLNVWYRGFTVDGNAANQYNAVTTPTTGLVDSTAAGTITLTTDVSATTRASGAFYIRTATGPDVWLYVQYTSQATSAGKTTFSGCTTTTGVAAGQAYADAGFHTHGVSHAYVLGGGAEHVKVMNCRGTSSSGSDTEMFHFEALAAGNILRSFCEVDGGSTVVTDLATTNNSVTATTNTGTPVAGMSILGSGIPGGTFITAVSFSTPTYTLTLSQKATATASNVRATFGYTSSGFSSNYATLVTDVSNRSHNLTLGMGHTSYHLIGGGTTNLRSFLNGKHGLNMEYCKDLIHSAPLCGGESTDIAGVNNAYAQSVDFGNLGSGVVILGCRKIALNGPICRKNGTSGVTGSESGLHVQGATASGEVTALDRITVAGGHLSDNKAYGVSVVNNGQTASGGAVMKLKLRGTEVEGNSSNNFNLPIGTLNRGTGPIPGSANPPAMPSSTVIQYSPYPFDCTVYIAGGTVTVISIDGDALIGTTATGLGATPATVHVPQGGSITLTYSSAPTWVWSGSL